MTTDELEHLPDRLAALLADRDWEDASAEVNKAAGLIRSLPVPLSPALAARLISPLNRNRRFADLVRLTGSLLLTGARSALVARRHAQGLIETGAYAEAESMLNGILAGRYGDATYEAEEATGLLGRLNKQLYLGPADGLGAFAADALQEAVKYYEIAFRMRGGHWPGINLVALLLRAKRDGVRPRLFEPTFDPIASARKFVADFAAATDTWELGTRLEALIALGDYVNAPDAAEKYIHSDYADGFEIASTLRQLSEVWGLTAEGPGGTVIVRLRSALLKTGGAGLTIPAHAEAAPPQQPGQLEAILGDERAKTLLWYETGLSCCKSIARVEDAVGTAQGTGWLIAGGSLHPAWAGKTLFITNKHVISPPTDDGLPYRPQPGLTSFLPDDSWLNFKQLGQRCKAGKVLFSSPDTKIDTTIVEIEDLPAGAKPLELSAIPLDMSQTRKPRVYVIGHPMGRDIEFSLSDNIVMDLRAPWIRYKAPTEGGSSGSPVFEEDRWKVVALHHFGGRLISQPGAASLKANEGVSIADIKAAVALRLAG